MRDKSNKWELFSSVFVLVASKEGQHMLARRNSSFWETFGVRFTAFLSRQIIITNY